jgi:hypothetical protein
MSVAMEEFFTPTRRHQEYWAALDGDNPPLEPREFNEVELSIPVEEFLSYRWDWKELFAFVSCDAVRKDIWITKDAFLCIEEMPIPNMHFDAGSLDDRMIAMIQEVGGQEQLLILVHLNHPEISLGETDVFWRAITTSNCVQLRIGNANRVGLPSGPLLSQLLRESTSLQVLQFRGFDFKEEHCRALVTMQRTDLKIKLLNCAFEPQDAEHTFIEWFRHNKVVTDIDCCQMGSRIISALSGNNSVKRLSFSATYRYDGQSLIALTEALPTNQGIEELVFTYCDLSVEECSLLFRSLRTHPRILYLAIREFNRLSLTSSAESMSTVMDAILQMLHLNTVITTIDLAPHLVDEEMWQNSIFPRLLLNRSWFESQCEAVKRADPSIRPQLLGRALYVVRYNPNLVFQFLSENVPAFVRTQE